VVLRFGVSSLRRHVRETIYNDLVTPFGGDNQGISTEGTSR